MRCGSFIAWSSSSSGARGTRHGGLVALFPAALYFGAPYSESLFLLVSGAFYAARTGRWAGGRARCGGHRHTQRGNVPRAALHPLARLPPARVRSLAWLALAPLGLAAYALHPRVAHGDAFAFIDAQDIWFRDFAGPFVGRGTARWRMGRHPPAQERRPRPRVLRAAGGDPFSVAAINLLLFTFLVFAAVAVVGSFRRLLAYGAYALAALALPPSVSGRSAAAHVAALRRGAVPAFHLARRWTEKRGWTAQVASASAAGLGLFTAQFATWEWIS